MFERKIYLARHGEIENPKGKKLYLGHSDPDLNQTGIEEAEQLALLLQDISFAKIYCSSLQRTTRTAEIIAQYHDLTPKLLNQLLEIDLGDWDGLSFAEVKEEYPEEFRKRGEDIIHYRVSGGESFFDCNQRVMKKFNQLLATTTGNLLIVAHAGVNRLILCNILKKPLIDLFQIPQDYGCLNIIAQDGEELEIKEINRK